MSNKSISQLTAGASVSSTDIFPDVQTSGVGPVKVTAAQIGNYVLSGSGLTGTLPVSNGGTGLTSLTAGYIPYASSSSAFSFSNLYSDGSNLGLGVTPSAWGVSQKAIQIKTFASFYDDEYNGTAVIGYNMYQSANSTFNYNFTGIAASRYVQGAGQHQWFISTGTPVKDAAISFTQAMTLDSSGNFNVGGTDTNVRGLFIGASATSANYAFAAKNSSGTLLLAARNDGYIIAAGVYSNTSASSANVFVDTDGSLKRSTSSLKYKTNIKNAIHGLNELIKLRSVTYNGINDGNKIFGGLIAEEVDAVGLSEFVVYDADGKPDALHYGPMVSLAFKAIQELAAEVAELKAKVA